MVDSYNPSYNHFNFLPFFSTINFLKNSFNSHTAFNLINGEGFKELAESLIKAGRQLGSAVSLDELLPDPTTVN